MILLEAAAYRFGSWVLSSLVLFILTGELEFAAGTGAILVLTHTTYYVLFRLLWGRWTKRWGELGW